MRTHTLPLTAAMIVALGACTDGRHTPGEAPPASSPSPAESEAKPLAEPDRKPAEPDRSPAGQPPANMFEDVAIAWYEPSQDPDALTLLCQSDAAWLHVDGAPHSCELEPGLDRIWIIDPHGVVPWTIQAREDLGSPRLRRPSVPMPPAPMPVLAMRSAPPAADARLIPVKASRPTQRYEDVEPAVVQAMVALNDEMRADELPLSPVMEVHGSFGRGADTIVVFEVDPSAPDYVGFQILVALVEGEYAGIFGDLKVDWSGHQLVGATDLDADSNQELLWWATSSVGLGVNLTHELDGVYRLTNLMSCQCGGAFESAYPAAEERTFAAD